MTPPSASVPNRSVSDKLKPDEKVGELTPPLVLRLADAARESRCGHVSRGRVSCSRGLANDEFARWDTGRDDLEKRSVGPSRGRGGEQARAGRVLRGALCMNRHPFISYAWSERSREKRLSRL